MWQYQNSSNFILSICLLIMLTPYFQDHHYTATLRYISPHFTTLIDTSHPLIYTSLPSHFNTSPHFTTLIDTSHPLIYNSLPSHFNTSLHLSTLHILSFTLHYPLISTLHYTYRHFTFFHLHFTTHSFGLTHQHFLSFCFTSHHWTRHSTVLPPALWNVKCSDVILTAI